MIDPTEFKRGMRRLAAGVSVITTIEDGAPQGFAATAVTSVAAEPSPTLLICVNRAVSCHDAIGRSGVFCVNLLAEDDVEVARLFSASEHRLRRFTDCEWRTLGTGAPALTAAIASFDCAVAEAVAVHSHTVFIGTVVGLSLRDDAAWPLLYADGRFDALRSAATPA
ncbi:flavin reductase family protein [Hansschlegelia plantiphila]|uniref:Flavin reductase n=1 Tax=Hansschlegelia plantiphila TaxID=374655 RepID=A0A9W6MWK9_9HYPH|nr:flavin reductase family protein [Hansschlegelia plantiphila]GLK69639.1 flavin reductase [Hansschlegelia plantiphila]